MAEFRRLSVCALFVAVLSTCYARNYYLYVSPTGDDTHDGRSIKTALKTVAKAVSMVNGLTTNSSDSVRIELLAGYHELENTLRINHYDAKVTIQSYQHQKAHLVGGKRIPGSAFKSVTDRHAIASLPAAARPHVRVVHLPDLNITNYGNMDPYGLGYFRRALEVSYNGKALHLARWPDEGFINIVGTPAGQHGKKFQYSSSVPRTWHTDNDTWVYGYWHEGWADLAARVSSIDTHNNLVTLTKDTRYGIRSEGHYGNLTSTTQAGYFRFENILSALDHPGEYYLDRTTGNLYVWVFNSNGAIATTDVITVSMVNNCIEMNYVENVILSDFTIESCRLNAIQGRQVKAVTVSHMEIRNTGGQAINFYYRCEDVHVSANLIHGTDGGMFLEGGNRSTLESSGIIIENNEIYDFTRNGATGRHGIYIQGVGHVARQNTIYNGRSDGLLYNTNDAIMEYNHVHHVCVDVNSCSAVHGFGDWTVRGNKVRNNVIHDIWKTVPGGETRGLSLDDHHSGSQVTNNVFFNNYVHLDISGGRDNLVSNNIFYNATTRSVRIEGGETSTAHLQQLLTRLRAVPYNSSLWISRYGDLAESVKTDADFLIPKGNEISKNIVYNTGDARFLAAYGQRAHLDLYNITRIAYSMGPVDHNDVKKGDYRVTCHARDWANQVNFVQAMAVNRMGPRSTVGPVYLKKTAYAPLTLGTHHGPCKYNHNANSTPTGPYLPDGTHPNTLYKTATQGCWLKVDKCTDNEYAVGLDRDTWGEANMNTSLNETACLAQAVTQWEECGSHRDEQVAAIYAPTGATTLGGDGCWVARYGCPKHGGPADGHAQTNGSMFRDGGFEHQTTPKTEESCLNRAAGHWRYCGSSPNHTVTYIYRPTGAKLTAGAGCWIYVDKCPAHLNTKRIFYDAFGATNLRTDEDEDSCLAQAFYYWKRCGSHPEHPVTAVYRPTTHSRTISG